MKLSPDNVKFDACPAYKEPEILLNVGSTGEKPSVVFDTLDYIGKADRKLYRINPNPGKDSDFLNRFGVLPFNPAAVEREDVLVPVKSPPQPKPVASIVRDGDKLFLSVTGGGRVKVNFKLKFHFQFQLKLKLAQRQS